MADIIYNGGLEELQSLRGDDLEIDSDKLLEWLVTSSSFEYSDEVKKKLNTIIRKKKLNKLTNDIS